MNEKSYDYVKNQLLYLGFGSEIAQPLREKMEQNLAEFTLPHTRKFGSDETQSILYFSKGDQKDMTFFNRFDTTLKQTGKEDLTQTFFVGKDYNYPLQERYNMMDGRAAYREQPKVAPVEENGEVRMKPTGETYFGWRGLDFKNTDQHGNFNPKVMFWNHEKEIKKYPIKDLSEPYDRNRLMASMEKGNKASVTILKDGQEIKATVAANPRMQRFDFYDTNGQVLTVRKMEKQEVAQAKDLGQSAAEKLKKGENKELDQQAAQKNGVADEQKDNAQRKKQGVHR